MWRTNRILKSCACGSARRSAARAARWPHDATAERVKSAVRAATAAPTREALRASSWRASRRRRAAVAGATRSAHSRYRSAAGLVEPRARSSSRRRSARSRGAAVLARREWRPGDELRQRAAAHAARRPAEEHLQLAEQQQARSASRASANAPRAPCPTGRGPRREPREVHVHQPQPGLRRERTRQQRLARAGAPWRRTPAAPAWPSRRQRRGHCARHRTRRCAAAPARRTGPPAPARPSPRGRRSAVPAAGGLSRHGAAGGGPRAAPLPARRRRPAAHRRGMDPWPRRAAGARAGHDAPAADGQGGGGAARMAPLLVAPGAQVGARAAARCGGRRSQLRRSTVAAGGISRARERDERRARRRCC